MPSHPDPVALLNAWLALEALQPQVFKKQEKLISDEPPRRKRGESTKAPARLLVPFDITSGQMPWESPAGDRKLLKLADDDTIRWYLPVAFVKMAPAIELLVNDVEPDGPERERGAGVAILALAPFDEKGFPAPSKLILSSFGWACGEVLAGRIDTLHQFIDVQEELCREIGDALIERAEDGCQIPTTKRGFSMSMTMLMQRLNLPKDILERPRVAIRVIGESDKEPVDIINSFFLRDLHRIRVGLQNDGGGPLLAAYLAQVKPEFRRDVLADKALLEGLIAPERLPLARWPAPKPAKLVTLQQAAVNTAMHDLADGGLLSVNGPPGTGKTTLLRDVVAAVILDRADALLEFKDPASAFSPIELVSESGHQRTLYALHTALRGHGIVVASSNNAAVRNVSAELPLAKTVASDLGVQHFSGTADTVHGEDGSCWGLIAAVLGNKSNRTDFVEDAWWHADWGLEKYLGAATGRMSRQAKAQQPKIVDAEHPPQSRGAAMERWRRACLEYRERRSKVAQARLLREQIRTALWTSASAQQALEKAQALHAESVEHISQMRETSRTAETALLRADAAVADARRLLDGNTALRPNALLRLIGYDAKWRSQQEHAVDLMRRALSDQEMARVEVLEAKDRIAHAEGQLNVSAAALAAAERQLILLRELEAQCETVCDGTHAGPIFWESSHDVIHKASPWLDTEFTADRDEMFVAAIRLHRAFMDAAAWPLKSNLGLIMDHLKGKRIPSGADVYLGDLWDSFFLVIPLVSTTFASFDRLMDGMGEGTIGWLIVDEAGQATPQAAVGALWRSRRALIIGDPLQIEPVSKVPMGLVRSICTSYGGVHPDLWAAPRASVQTLADAASPLMTVLGSGADAREIGLPLLVHRRCEDPMFSISNEIAYEELMVHAVKEAPSPIADALSSWLPKSCWLDVASEAEKWSRSEGEAVIDLLRRLAGQGIREPNVYIISPFREVADRLRNFVVKSGVLDDLGIPVKKQKNWGETRVGTVHTFQGKEAEAVLLVLGASATARRGSRNWAGSTPNILNVAATRAKQAFYVIGRHDVWATAGVFAVAARRLPVVPWPFDSSTPICLEGEVFDRYDEEQDEDASEMVDL